MFSTVSIEHQQNDRLYSVSHVTFCAIVFVAADLKTSESKMAVID